MADDETLAFYDQNAEAVAEKQTSTAPHAHLLRFLGALHPGATVLDFGCGSGWAAAEMAERGFLVDAIDGSAGMVAEARRRTGLSVAHIPFDAFAAHLAYDGVFASFSLLHLRRSDAPRIVGKIWDALKPSGLLYVGVKACSEGTRERRDALGRFFTDYKRADLEEMLIGAGFKIVWTEDGSGVGTDGVRTEQAHILASKAQRAAPTP